MAKKRQLSKKEKKLHTADIIFFVSFFVINALEAAMVIDKTAAEMILAVLCIVFGAVAGWRSRDHGISAFIWWALSVIASFYLINLIIKIIIEN